MTADDLTAELGRIAADIEETVAVYNLDGADKNSYPVSAAMIRHARPLLAAVEAVLELADTWDAQAKQASDRSDAANESGETGTFYLAVGKALTLDECIDALREAISRKITGKEESE